MSNNNVNLWSVSGVTSIGITAINDTDGSVKAFTTNGEILEGNMFATVVRNNKMNGYMYEDSDSKKIVTGLGAREYIHNLSVVRNSIMSVPFGPNKAPGLFAQKQTGYGTGKKQDEVLVDKTGIFTSEQEVIYYMFITLSNDEIRELIKRAHKIEEFGNEEYVSIKPIFIEKDGVVIEQHPVSMEDVNRIFECIKSVDWNKDEYINMLRVDIDDICTAYQGVVIDSTKKVLDVVLPHFFSMKDIRIEHGIKMDINREYIDDNDIKGRKIQKVEFARTALNKLKSRWEEQKALGKDTPVLIETDLAQLQEVVGEELAELLNGEYKKQSILRDDFARIINNHRDDVEFVNDIVSLRYFFNNVIGELIDTNNNSDKIKDADDRNNARMIANEIFNKRISLLNDTIHWYAKKHDADIKTMIGCVMYVNQLISGSNGSLYDTDRRIANEVRSTFAMNVCKDEILCMLNNFNTIYKPRTKVINKGEMEVGDYAMFVNGVSGNTIVDDSITETGKMVDVDGKLYIECVRELKVDRSFANKTAFVCARLFKGKSINTELPLEIRYQEKEREEISYYEYLDTNTNKMIKVEETLVGFAIMQEGIVIGVLSGATTGVVRKSLIGRVCKIEDITQFTDLSVKYPGAIVKVTIQSVIKDNDEALLRALGSNNVDETADNIVDNNTMPQDIATEDTEDDDITVGKPQMPSNNLLDDLDSL